MNSTSADMPHGGHPMASDMPQITSSVYGSSTSVMSMEPSGGIIWGYEPATWDADAAIASLLGDEKALHRAGRHQATRQPGSPGEPTPNPMPNQSTTRRLVQVFIADPDPNIPLASALLYRGELKFTDATDQELYFEVPVVELLAKHNSERIKWPDKEASKRAGKDVLLEPARVRDLRMVVVTVASF